MPRTQQQNDIIAELVSGTGHLAIVARAGCGKTTTILDGVNEIALRFPRAEITVAAYNKSIADEVKEKLIAAGHTGRSVNASTLHGLGFGLVRFAFNNPKVDDKKVKNIIASLDNQIAETYAAQIEKVVGYAKASGVGFFSDLPIENPATWYTLADHYDINGFDDQSDSEAVFEVARQVYRLSLAQTHVIDFDDMILFPLMKNLRVRFTKDFLFLDEAQDLSRTRQALAKKFVKRDTGRIIVVGDDRQAIYGFSGADSAALPNMIEQLRAKVLPLSVSWRCPRAVIARAQTIVPDIQAAPNAAEGEVISVDSLPENLNPGEDAILCRNTAPLITLAYSLIRRKIPAKVEGRAIGDGLIVLARRWKVRSLDKLLVRLDDYREREVQKAMSRDNEQKAEEVTDRVSTLEAIIRACIEQGKTEVSDVVNFIQDLFVDGDTKSVILATYHRSKGREWNRVFLFEHDTRCPSKAARQPWQLEQEANLAYVAFTRARHTLAFVTPSKDKK